MNIHVDLSLTLLLIILKFTTLPQMSIGIIFLPLIIGFVFNFTKGFIDGWRDRNG